jgi:hypothetical protein
MSQTAKELSTSLSFPEYFVEFFPNIQTIVVGVNIGSEHQHDGVVGAAMNSLREASERNHGWEVKSDIVLAASAATAQEKRRMLLLSKTR